jgi:endonuclease YncB( thermonuclease family)
VQGTTLGVRLSKAYMGFIWKLFWLIAGAGIAYLAIDQWPQDWQVWRGLETAPRTQLPTVRRFRPNSPQPDPATHLAISVIDGDTISLAGKPNVRLVGCNAPETGRQARCSRERDLAQRATIRLRELVANGPVQLTYVRCSCPEGTHGTKACNHGRDCARLSVGGRDACSLLIAEGLAHSFVCGPTSCPPRRSWCN